MKYLNSTLFAATLGTLLMVSQIATADVHEEETYKDSGTPISQLFEDTTKIKVNYSEPSSTEQLYNEIFNMDDAN
jgi:spermidine/putrescine-binding protein